MSTLAAFGLADYASAKEHKLEGFENSFLSDVVLPIGLVERVLAGDEAEQSRVHSGYEWPKEARIPDSHDAVLRRVPVPLLWNNISDLSIENEPRVRWKLENGGEISTARLLAAHCRNIFNRAGLIQNGVDACICVPANILESAQDYFLSELKHEGIVEARLLYRDIAAMFSAINKGVFDEVRTVIDSQKVLVVHAGIDQIECSVRELCCEIIGGKELLVPERKLGRSFDLGSFFTFISSLIPQFIGEKECPENSSWKLITSSDSFWEVLLGKSANESDLLFLESWTSFEHKRDVIDDVIAKGLSGEMVGEQWVENLIKSTMVSQISGHNSTDIRSAIAMLGEEITSENISVVLFSGALFSNPSVDTFFRKIFEIEGQISPIYISESDLCDGGDEYLRRIRCNEPTYYDHIAPLSLLVADGVHLSWFDIISQDQTKVAGGSTFRRTIKNEISIDRGSDNLDIVLRSGATNSKRIRAANDVVEEYVFQSSPPNLSEPEACFVRCIARGLVTPSDKDNAWIDEDENRKKYKELLDSELLSPNEWQIDCRTLSFELPYKAPANVMCDLAVESSPASGRARLTLKTIKSDFAKYREFPADYSSMKKASLADSLEGKKLSTGWPPLNETPVFPNLYIFSETYIANMERYLASPADGAGYIDLLKGANAVLKLATPRVDFDYRWMPVANQNCVRSEGDLVSYISKFSHKLKIDFQYFQDFETKRKILTQSSYLYFECPSCVKSFAFSHLHDFGTANYHFLFLSISRIVEGRHEIKQVLQALFDWAEKRQSKGESPLQYSALTGLLFLLRYRKYTEELIAPEYAVKLCGWVLDAIEGQILQQNIKLKFRQAVLTLLYLFRIRRADPTFLYPGGREAMVLESKLKIISQAGQTHAKDEKSKNDISDVISSIIGYINYKPDHSIIATFNEEEAREDG